MSKRCQKCGSAKIIPNMQILDHMQYLSKRLEAVSYANPEALLFKGRVYAHLNATICGACGNTEITAENPEALYDAYLSSLASAKILPKVNSCSSCGLTIPSNANHCAACGGSNNAEPLPEAEAVEEKNQDEN